MIRGGYASKHGASTETAIVWAMSGFRNENFEQKPIKDPDFETEGNEGNEGREPEMSG